MKERMCRLGEMYGKKGIKVCKHISIDGKIQEDDGCEYIEELNIYCKECRKKYPFKVLIN